MSALGQLLRDVVAVTCGVYLAYRDARAGRTTALLAPTLAAAAPVRTVETPVRTRHYVQRRVTRDGRDLLRLDGEDYARLDLDPYTFVAGASMWS